jgi:DNA-directed RNA polymerase subunit RPC12/RpoP
MNIGPLLLMLVIITTLIINYLNNRCPNCKKWQIKGFNRLDEVIDNDDVKVYCSRCNHKWAIKYKKSDFQPKKDS